MELIGQVARRVVNCDIFVDLLEKVLLLDAEMVVKEPLEDTPAERGGGLRAVVKDR
jgi:hypothetical protein